jgi:peptidoglycan L-alanyl-D-glutamate endopeptidase CwlK
MRLNWRGKLLLLILVLITILFFIPHLEKGKPLTESKIKHSVPLPTKLNSIVEERSQQLVQKAADKGITILITDGFRSSKDQDELYEQGRTADGNIVTNAKGGESYHNFGLAIDFALETPSGDVIWDMQYDGNNNDRPDWNEVVAIAKTLGFKWGGDWKQFKDYPHLEMDFGLSIADLQEGERPPKSTMTADVQ